MRSPGRPAREIGRIVRVPTVGKDLQSGRTNSGRRPAAPQNADVSGQTMVSRWRRDYRLSLILFGAGCVMAVGISVFSYWANSTGNYPTSLGASVAILAIQTDVGVLMLLAATAAYYHWRGLKLIENGS